MFDQLAGRQWASLRINGQAGPDWYVVEGNPHLRWAERDIFLGPEFTRGREHLEIELTPKPGSPPWTATEYQLLCLRP